MSIARAFTTRRVKQSMQAAEAGNAPNRANSMKGLVGSIRHKISSPVELIHTTNMLSYNAPDIHPTSASPTSSSQRSDDDVSDSALTNGTTPPTSPDIESLPKRSQSREPNHLSSYFTISSDRQPAVPAAQPEAPAVPQRALSHSMKKPHNIPVRQRSASGMSQQSQRTVSTKASFSFSRSSSSSTSTSATSHSSGPAYHRSKLSSTVAAASPAASYSPASPPRPQLPRQQQQQQRRKDFSESQHPFGPELAQVSEIAEEYGVKEQVVDVINVEEQEMLEKGLLKFSAEEYLSEVSGLFASFILPPRDIVAASTWI